MVPTSSFCRIQEAAQRARAAREPLANVRQIALSAAAAWNAEARRAHNREIGWTGAASSPDAIRLSAEEEAEDRQLAHPVFTENPDRGLANA